MQIKGYEIKGELKTNNSGFSKWGFATKNGRDYFIKEFIDPVYPIHTELLDQAMIDHKRKICKDYEDRSRCMYNAINNCSDGNLVEIEEFFRDGSHYYLVMEKITGVSMTLVKKLPEADKIRICKALLHCMEGLHHAGIVHADVKLDNVLFRKLPSGKITGKVIDFDNSFWEARPPSPEEEIMGDPVYMAPETFVMMEEEEGRLTRAIDVFALGIVFHQIFTGELPEFDHKKYDYAFEAVLDGGGLTYSRVIPELWRNMIIAMTEKNVKKRITLDEAERMWKGTVHKATSTMGNFFSSAGDL